MCIYELRRLSSNSPSSGPAAADSAADSSSEIFQQLEIFFSQKLQLLTSKEYLKIVKSLKIRIQTILKQLLFDLSSVTRDGAQEEQQEEQQQEWVIGREGMVMAMMMVG